MIAGQVSKKYVAIVHGCPTPEDGTIDGPIDRDPMEPHRRIVTKDGYPALTFYKVTQAVEQASLVELRLGTGRTHQIRVHMTSIGHPLIGDKMYQVNGVTDHREINSWIERQALHAVELGFKHPLTGVEMLFTAPLPEDMTHLLYKLNLGGIQT
ncbi:Ribosomal large subunit pseudouridine synthase D [compost metagenome]